MFLLKLVEDTRMGFKSHRNSQSLYLQVLFDNQFHSGQLKITLDMDTYSFACKTWKISGTGKAY